MYFNDLLPPDADVAAYKNTLLNFSKLIEDSVRSLAKAITVAEKAAATDGKRHHISTFALARHVGELVDGVAVLSLEGCAVPCRPLMRSAMEAHLGVLYILDSDTERRAWAYQIAHVHRKIKLYRSLDPEDESGKQTLAMMRKDAVASGMELPKFDAKRLIANLEKMLLSPECASIEAEWQRLRKVKKGKDPHWYSLFSGPSDVRTLAERLNNLAQYDFCYRNWSNLVHAGGCLENYVGSKGGGVHIRPIRHPEGLQATVAHAVAYCFATSRRLLAFYGTADDMAEFRGFYITNIKPLSDQLHKGELINVPWR